MRKTWRRERRGERRRAAQSAEMRYRIYSGSVCERKRNWLFSLFLLEHEARVARGEHQRVAHSHEATLGGRAGRAGGAQQGNGAKPA